MPTREPTVAFVHGAFAESASWNSVIDRLYHHATVLVAGNHHLGFRDIVAIANPLRGVSSDAAYVADVLRAIDGPIVLVGHSYGGCVITQAAAQIDAVVALVFVAAFAPDSGESAAELSSKFPGSTLEGALIAASVGTSGDELTIRHDLFHHQFAADVPATQAMLMAATQRPVTRAALSEALPTDTPAWKRIPSWFVYGEQDLNIPAALCRFEAERAQSRGTREIAGASHAISVSEPEVVAEIILEAIAASRVGPLAAA